MGMGIWEGLGSAVASNVVENRGIEIRWRRRPKAGRGTTSRKDLKTAGGGSDSSSRICQVDYVCRDVVPLTLT